MAGKITVSTINDSSGVLATQNGMTGIAKAWVMFAANTGTAVINSSFNVSSVTRNSAGNFTVNFTTAMPSSTYASAVTSGTLGTNYGIVQLGTPTTTSLTFGTFTIAGTGLDSTYNVVAIFSA